MFFKLKTLWFRIIRSCTTDYEDRLQDDRIHRLLVLEEKKYDMPWFLAKLRENRGITIDKASDLTKIKRIKLYSFEDGTHIPTEKEMKLLAYLYQVDPKILIQKYKRFYQIAE